MDIENKIQINQNEMYQRKNNLLIYLTNKKL